MYRFFLAFSTLLNLLSASLAAHDSRPYLIIANAPNLDPVQAKQYSLGRTVIALDGAADKLREVEIYPDVILGDFDSIRDIEFWGITHTFDSINDQAQSYLSNTGVLIVPAKDQDHTDLEKAIDHCDVNNATSIIIINADGGRMDHTLGNIRTLRKYHNVNRSLRMVTDTQELEFVREGTATIEGKIGDYCAIMAFPQAKMSSSGLKYDTNDFPLEFAFSESTCNSLKHTTAKLVITGDALVIHPLNTKSGCN